MQKHPDLTRRRIRNFIHDLIEPRLWTITAPLSAEVHRPGGGLRDYREMRIDPAAAAGFTYTPVEKGYQWGPEFTDAWFRFTGAVPAEWAGRKVYARIDTGVESIVWDGDDPLQGLDRNHGEILLFSEAAGGEPVSLTVQATAMDPSVEAALRPYDRPATPFTFSRAELAVRDEELWGLYYDLRVAASVMDTQPKDSPRYGQLLHALNDTLNLYDREDPATIPAMRACLARTFERPASASAHQISAIGHSHIDSAWLWPIERTQYKCIHTFATATRYMDMYPEYRFICPQAAQYEWIKRMAPKLYERIRAKIQTGQFEPAGSMWVEADCNLTGGEALVRQIVLAKNFWMDEFGIETKDLWLPDVFGYAAAMPQILRKSRVDYFLTQKISWSQFNRFPHHTFLWQGIDGTRVFSHFPPADTYCSSMEPEQLAYNVTNFQENDRATRSLYVYGHGDGGGGPEIRMLEYARRLRDVEGMPRVELERACDFFPKAQEDACDLPVWAGELYLEYHRGTLTTHAANKRGNRKSELMLRDAEFLSVINPDGIGAYPAEALDRTWKTVLLNQFHDIIPGSSIEEVYVDSDQDYAEIAQTVGGLIGEAAGALARSVDTRGAERPVVVVSNLSAAGPGAVEVPLAEGETAASAVGPDGAVVPVQIVAGEDGGRAALFVALDVPAHGHAVWSLSDAPAPATPGVAATPSLLENDILRIELDPVTGLLTRIYDKRVDREVLQETHGHTADREAAGYVLPATGNQFQYFNDVPVDADAWDIDIFYQDRVTVISAAEAVEVAETGPVRGAIRIVRAVGNSRVTQTIRLTAGSARIDFVTEAEWDEWQKMLKVAFPVSINSPHATYEIQYGNLERPTHFNTSWDMARFECCAHKWVDLSEGDYGVALLNDCKYGHDVHGNVLRMTLLRAPKRPDQSADIGSHRFTYALLPHPGDYRAGGVVREGYALNAPLQAYRAGANQPGPAPASQSWFAVDNPAVVIEAVKKAERSDDVIVRFYEAHNTRGKVTLRTALPVNQAWLADMMEDPIAELALEDGAVTLSIKPFEIITVRLSL